MLGLKKKDSNKEIELIATIADFNQDYVKALKLICASEDVQNPKAIASRILKELIDFNIYAYKSYVNKKLYSTCLKWRRHMRDSLFISIQQC